MAHPLDAERSDTADNDTRTAEQREVEQVLPQPGMSFRGGFGDLTRDAYEIGKAYRHIGVLRSSRDPRIATDNFADPDIVVLFGRDARDLGRASDDLEEAETVFSPDPTFTVITRTQIEARQDARLGGELINRLSDRRADQREDERLGDQPWLTVIVVHGHRPDPPTNIQDAVQRAVHAIAGVRELGPATIDSPGRYRGPIGVDETGRLQLTEV